MQISESKGHYYFLVSFRSQFAYDYDIETQANFEITTLGHDTANRTSIFDRDQNRPTVDPRFSATTPVRRLLPCGKTMRRSQYRLLRDAFEKVARGEIPPQR